VVTGIQQLLLLLLLQLQLLQKATDAGQQGCVLKPNSCPSSNYFYLIWLISAAMLPVRLVPIRLSRLKASMYKRA
jgi:hypothetical protein